MKNYITIAAVLAAFSFLSSVHAGRIVVSGDANILNPIAVGSGTGIEVGNQTFFKNILGTGSKVLIDSDGFNGVNFSGYLSSYYNGLLGVTASVVGVPVSAASLVGIDVFATIVPSSAYTGSEISALKGFLAGGGTAIFLGDQGFFSANNGYINSALAALGSSMSISASTIFDGTYAVATGAQIAVDPLTAGVSAIKYAIPSEVTVSGGTSLVYGSGGRAFIATENIAVPDSGTSVVLLLGGLSLLVFVRRRR